MVDTRELIDFLLLFKKDEYIYPSTIKNKFKFDDKMIYNILNILEEHHLIKMYYELFCYTCNRSIRLYERFSQIDEMLMCDICETNFDLNNIKIVYKVIK